MPGIVSEMAEPELAKKKIKKSKKVKVTEELDSGVQEDLPKVKKSKKKVKVAAELAESENTQSVKKTKKRKQEDSEQPTKKKQKKSGRRCVRSEGAHDQKHGENVSAKTTWQKHGKKTTWREKWDDQFEPLFYWVNPIK